MSEQQNQEPTVQTPATMPPQKNLKIEEDVKIIINMVKEFHTIVFHILEERDQLLINLIKNRLKNPNLDDEIIHSFIDLMKTFKTPEPDFELVTKYVTDFYEKNDELDFILFKLFMIESKHHLKQNPMITRFLSKVSQLI